jgi:hypothetical protein
MQNGPTLPEALAANDAVEANIPLSRVINLQKEYVDKGYEIKVIRRKGQPDRSATRLLFGGL